MSRSLWRSWKGVVKDGQLVSVRHSFTHRYRVYCDHNAAGEESNFRVNLEDESGSRNFYPPTRAALEELLSKFKEGKINAFGHALPSSAQLDDLGEYP